MKYWGFLLAKLLAVLTFAYASGRALFLYFPKQYTAWKLHPFMHDLPYTMVVMLHFLMVAGLIWLCFWDQRYRCRTCLRKLRMPVANGGWHHVILGPPRTDYICPFGHGTLRVQELSLDGTFHRDWQEHDEDIWKELYALEDNTADKS